MIINANFIYLILALGIVLLMWVISLLVLVILLRRRLKTVTEQRDQQAAHLHTIISLIGRTAVIRQGERQGQSGTVLWIHEEDAGLQIGGEQVVVSLADLAVTPKSSEF